MGLDRFVRFFGALMEFRLMGWRIIRCFLRYRAVVVRSGREEKHGFVGVRV